jgi:hypothetical protein
MAKQLVVCVENDGYAVSLEKRKIYVALRDTAAGKHELLRIVDESGEDYLYPKALFRSIACRKRSKGLCWRPSPEPCWLTGCARMTHQAADSRAARENLLPNTAVLEVRWRRGPQEVVFTLRSAARAFNSSIPQSAAFWSKNMLTGMNASFREISAPVSAL